LLFGAAENINGGEGREDMWEDIEDIEMQN
jgi:hypothetical protein